MTTGANKAPLVVDVFLRLELEFTGKVDCVICYCYYWCCKSYYLASAAFDLLTPPRLTKFPPPPFDRLLPLLASN